MRTLTIAVMTVAVLGTALPAAANDYEPALRELAASKIKDLMNNPAVVAAIKAQNEKNAGLSQADIDSLDKTWRAEVGGSATPTIDPVLTGPVADMLRAAAEESEGLFTEIFLMDNHGLNVAASDTTSDYWQGDEDKWQQTFGVGGDAVHISEVELDESTQSYQSQVSVSVVDPETNQPIGAATFGVSVEMLD